MPTIDDTSLDQLRTQLAQAEADGDQMSAEIVRLRAMPETIAKMIEGFTADQIRMACGEMTAQEMRTVRAVQRWWVSAIRHKATMTAPQQPTPATPS